MKNKVLLITSVFMVCAAYFLGGLKEPKLSSPMTVVLYDRTNKAIMQYETYPEIENGVLKLLDSDLLYEEHDCEWDNMIR